MRVAEQPGSGKTIQRLCDGGIWIGILARRPHLTLAKETFTTGNCEGNHDSITDLQFLDGRSDLNYLAHEFVTEDVTLFHRWNVAVVKVKVRTANGGCRDLKNDIFGVQYARIRYIENLNIFFPIPARCFHRSSPAFLT